MIFFVPLTSIMDGQIRQLINDGYKKTTRKRKNITRKVKAKTFTSSCVTAAKNSRTADIRRRFCFC